MNGFPWKPGAPGPPPTPAGGARPFRPPCGRDQRRCSGETREMLRGETGASTGSCPPCGFFPHAAPTSGREEERHGANIEWFMYVHVGSCRIPPGLSEENVLHSSGSIRTRLPCGISSPGRVAMLVTVLRQDRFLANRPRCRGTPRDSPS